MGSSDITSVRFIFKCVGNKLNAWGEGLGRRGVGADVVALSIEAGPRLVGGEQGRGRKLPRRGR